MPQELLLPIEPWLKFTGTLVGRDKVLRTIQYFSRFLIWWYETRQFSKETLTRIQKVASSVGQTRKCKMNDAYLSSDTRW
jgi:peroxin-11B